jgi:hypothetical protein
VIVTDFVREEYEHRGKNLIIEADLEKPAHPGI